MTKHVDKMTPEELSEAFRIKAWRTPATPPPKPAANAAKHPRDMNATEFEAACKARGWRISK